MLKITIFGTFSALLLGLLNPSGYCGCLRCCSDLKTGSFYFQTSVSLPPETTGTSGAGIALSMPTDQRLCSTSSRALCLKHSSGSKLKF